MKTENAVGINIRPYTLAGWISIIHAVIILPRIGADLFIDRMTLSGYDMVQFMIGFNAVGKLLGIYVLLMFRRFLNERHSFHKADKPITALILFHAAFAIAWALNLILHSYFDLLFALPIISILANLTMIFYAVRLLKLESALSGLLKPYVYTTIVAGILGATLILGQYGLPLYMVSLILLGMILIRAESEPEYL